MPIGVSKSGLLGAGVVPGGSETFNSSGTFTAPTGVTTVNLSGFGAAGNNGVTGSGGQPGAGGAGGNGASPNASGPTPVSKRRIIWWSWRTRWR